MGYNINTSFVAIVFNCCHGKGGLAEKLQLIYYSGVVNSQYFKSSSFGKNINLNFSVRLPWISAQIVDSAI